ncbi:MAG TPA: hypothetical protein VGP73_12060 [Thermoanaerobaculia bacterium]
MDFTLLNVAIGLVLIYTLLSLLCSTINEGITSFTALRAKGLQKSLGNLLGPSLSEDVYNHHLIQGLVPADSLWAPIEYLASKLGIAWRGKPSYIPTKTFVMTLLDSVGRKVPAADPAIQAAKDAVTKITDPDTKKQLEDFISHAESAMTSAQAGPVGFPQSVEEFRLAIESIPEDHIRKALLALVEDAQGDYDKLKTNLGAWFDGSMERVSGWYKREVKRIILVISILVSFGVGVDTVYISQTLWTDPVLRAALVKAAEEEVRSAPTGPKNQQNQSDNANPGAPASAPAPAAGAPAADVQTTSDAAGMSSDPPVTSDTAQASQPPASAGSKASQDQKGSKQPEGTDVDKIHQAVKETQQQLTKLDVPLFPFGRGATYREWLAADSKHAGMERPGFRKLLGFWLQRHFLGMFLTAAALSLGAPFWFDLLSKLVELRSAGKRPEEGTAPSQV